MSPSSVLLPTNFEAPPCNIKFLAGVSPESIDPSIDVLAISFLWFSPSSVMSTVLANLSQGDLAFW